MERKTDRENERRRLKRKGVIDLTFIEVLMVGTLARHGIHRAAPAQAGAGAQGLHSPAKIHTNTFLMRPSNDGWSRLSHGAFSQDTWRTGNWGPPADIAHSERSRLSGEHV